MHSINNTSTEQILVYTEATKELLKQEIIQAFNKGNFGFRSISFNKEKLYLQQTNKNPRPVYLVAPRVSMKTRIINQKKECIIGIINIKTLFPYKKNALTMNLTDDGGPEIYHNNKLFVKALADKNALLEKEYELSNRKFEVYPLFTSGHLKVDGSFSLPKAKNESNITDSLDHSELLMTNYEKEQIKCYCINETDTRDITDIIKHKQEIEKKLAIKNLPIVIYSEKNGAIKIFFAESLSNKFDILKKNIDTIEYLSYLSNIDIMDKLTKILPLSSRIDILCNSNLDLGLSITEELINTVKVSNAITKLVTEYKNYSVADLRILLQQGINIKRKLHIGNNKFESFADKLIGSIHDITSQENITALTIALDILNELLRNGVSYSGKDFNCLLRLSNKNYIPIINSCVAANIPLEEIYAPYLLNSILEHSSGSIVMLDKKLQQQTKNAINDNIFLFIYTQLEMRYGVDNFIKTHSSLFIILFLYGANPNSIQLNLIAELTQYKDFFTEAYKKSFGNQSAKQIFEEISHLWENRKTHQTYINWSKKLQQAKQEIATLQKELGITNNNSFNSVGTEDIKHADTLLSQFFTNIFATTLVFNNEDNNNDKIIASILDNYYRLPGPQQLLKKINLTTSIPIWKSIHSSSHVLRAYNNACWYMSLLEKFKIANFSDDEKIILPLAAIYHDAAAEDVSKINEEKKSAYYFKRDLQGMFSQQLLEKVALALENKEDDIHNTEKKSTDKDYNKYIMVVRFADRMDFIRCSTIDNDFPNFTRNVPYDYFNVKLLNLPEIKTALFYRDKEKILFQRHLDAAMHGAIDLAEVTGGYNQDLRKKGSYDKRYQLSINNIQLKTALEYTNAPITTINETVNNNVRRTIAKFAGINTCSDPKHNSCKADTSAGISSGIHSTWHDLKQVKVPDVMTLLEKMQIEHDITLLSEDSLIAVNLEISRLKAEGIQMSLGTLTQDVLNSDKAQKVLKQLGITVISELRGRCFKESGEQVFYEMLIPVKNSANSNTSRKQVSNEILIPVKNSTNYNKSREQIVNEIPASSENSSDTNINTAPSLRNWVSEITVRIIDRIISFVV